MREEVYDISGMHCAACSASVEKVTRRLPGVERSDVNLVAERMTIVYDETQVTPEQIIAKVEKAGFGAKLHQEKQEAAPVQTGEDPEEAELRRKKRELIVSAIFSCALLYVSMGQMLPFGLPALPLPDLFSMHTHPMNFAVLQLMLAIPVLYCGRNFFINGFQALFHGNPNMDSLVAIGSACSFVYSVVMMFLITDDVHGHVHNLYYESSAVVLTLVSLGKFMESRNMKKTKSAITALMRLTPDTALLADSGKEVPTSAVKAGDVLLVKPGARVPLDGVVVKGESSVNEAMLTGESLPVEKSAGSGRYDRIIRMIEESEKLKSTAEDKASRLADRLVPYTLGGTILTYLITRNVTKMLAVLMVDFSCALKLSMPIAVLSAMRESSSHHISVKGGRFLEAVAQANTIVFDKTGTLTYATPKVARIVTFGGNEESEMLRLAACLEEHYPHSIANAVVAEARDRGLTHEEYHSQVQYVVAHGISSMVDEKTVLIGSAHFVFEDEGCRVPEGEEDKFESLPPEYSHLYLCIAGELAAVICIHDPLRKEAKAAVRALHELGIDKVVMMTGDSERTARAIAEKVGVDQYFSEVLPEDKAGFVEREKALGHKVIMIGDGINDSPALSAADVGIAISEGAEIAREIADITISEENLYQLVTLKAISNGLMKRIHGNYRFVIGFNLGLILLGVAGVIAPATSALLHNTSTLGISLKSMTNLLNEQEKRKEYEEAEA